MYMCITVFVFENICLYIKEDILQGCVLDVMVRSKHLVKWTRAQMREFNVNWPCV